MKVILLAISAIFASTSIGQDVKPALRGLDPVLLCLGQQVPGKAEHSAQHAEMTFYFSDASTRTMFLADKERYAPQFDGACMKMGPGSGKGGQDRFAVHNGRIYLFASDSCYQWFVLNPERYIDVPDQPIQPTQDDIEKASKWMKKAIEFSGGVKAVSGMTSLQVTTEFYTPEPESKLTHTIKQTWMSDGRFRTDYDYDGYVYADLLLKDGYRSLFSKVEVGGSQTTAFFRRSATHNHLVLLQRYLTDSAKVGYLGNAMDNAGAFHRVAVFADGSLNILCIDEATGRIRSLDYIGRSGPGISRIVKHLSDYRLVNGIQVPFGVQTVLDGQPVKTSIAKTTAVEVNKSVPDELWVPKAFPPQGG